VRHPQRPFQEHVLLPEPAVLDLLAHLHLEQIDVEGFAEIVARAQAHRFDCGVSRCERRDHDAEDVLIDSLGGPQYLDAAQVRHFDVRNQDVDRLVLECVDGRSTAVGQKHLIPLPAQDYSQQLSHRALIVDHEDPRGTAIAVGVGRRHGVPTGCSAGNRTDTVVPLPGCELTRISPL
jgi:hypothetical protein